MEEDAAVRRTKSKNNCWNLHKRFILQLVRQIEYAIRYPEIYGKHKFKLKNLRTPLLLLYAGCGYASGISFYGIAASKCSRFDKDSRGYQVSKEIRDFFKERVNKNKSKNFGQNVAVLETEYTKYPDTILRHLVNGNYDKMFAQIIIYWAIIDGNIKVLKQFHEHILRLKNTTQLAKEVSGLRKLGISAFDIAFPTCFKNESNTTRHFSKIEIVPHYDTNNHPKDIIELLSLSFLEIAAVYGRQESFQYLWDTISGCEEGYMRFNLNCILNHLHTVNHCPPNTDIIIRLIAFTFTNIKTTMYNRLIKNL